MSALPEERSDLMTVDQLAGEAGITVRTTRYYASLGLLPPPERRGRMAFYGPEHLARLGLVKALQSHGFTMAGIEKAMARIPLEASVDDLGVQRAILTSWSPTGPEVLDRAELMARAGRVLADAEIDLMAEIGVLEQVGRTYSPLPGFELTVELLDLNVPTDGIREATDAIERHMRALVDELGVVQERWLLTPYREGERTVGDPDQLEVTVERLRALTLQAIVTGFQRAANRVISRALRAR